MHSKLFEDDFGCHFAGGSFALEVLNDSKTEGDCGSHAAACDEVAILGYF